MLFIGSEFNGVEKGRLEGGEVYVEEVRGGVCMFVSYYVFTISCISLFHSFLVFTLLSLSLAFTSAPALNKSSAQL